MVVKQNPHLPTLCDILYADEIFPPACTTHVSNDGTLITAILNIQESDASTDVPISNCTEKHALPAFIAEADDQFQRVIL